MPKVCENVFVFLTEVRERHIWLCNCISASSSRPPSCSLTLSLSVCTGNSMGCSPVESYNPCHQGHTKGFPCCLDVEVNLCLSLYLYIHIRAWCVLVSVASVIQTYRHTCLYTVIQTYRHTCVTCARTHSQTPPHSMHSAHSHRTCTIDIPKILPGQPFDA